MRARAKSMLARLLLLATGGRHRWLCSHTKRPVSSAAQLAGTYDRIIYIEKGGLPGRAARQWAVDVGSAATRWLQEIGFTPSRHVVLVAQPAVRITWSRSLVVVGVADSVYGV